MSGLNCNIVKSERGRGILWFEAEPGKSSESCWPWLAKTSRDPRMWKISLFYLNRILNFNSESITGIILYGIL